MIPNLDALWTKHARWTVSRLGLTSVITELALVIAEHDWQVESRRGGPGSAVICRPGKPDLHMRIRRSPPAILLLDSSRNGRTVASFRTWGDVQRWRQTA